MKIVIEIDNEHYERIMRLEEGVTVYPTTLALYEAVKNGTPFEAQPTSDDEIIKALKAVRTFHNGNYAPQIDEAIRRLEAQPTEMRDATEEEQKSTKDYISSISKPTGFHFNEAFEEELDFMQPHKKIPCTITVGKPCEDCISREAVRELICQNNDKYGYSDRFHEFTEKCLQLQPITPQRSKGKWIKVITDKDDFGETWHFKCSICGKKSNKGYRPLENYCHNCGAEMEVNNADSD